MPSLLAITKDALLLKVVSAFLDSPDDVFFHATSGDQGYQFVVEQFPDLMLIDMTVDSAMEVFQRVRQFDARIPILSLTNSVRADAAIEAMKLGAYDCWLKDNLLDPGETDSLVELMDRGFEISRLMRIPAQVPDDPPSAGPVDPIIGRCQAMQEVYKAIGRVAAQDITVLLLGESGTGKELVARAIYQHSFRSAGPFLAINCAAIPETLLESELFGHEKGSFTGADQQHIGKFEQCSGGTLFLDEIGDMSPMTQAKILRVVQDQNFVRVGGNETIRTNVRLVAATNRDLAEMVQKGQFRSDLYYRLSGFTIEIPPLREREGDLPALVNHFLRRSNRRLRKNVTQISPETLERFRSYHWPGNVRELQSVIQASLLQATGSVLLPSFLPACFQAGEPSKESEHSKSPDFLRLIHDGIQQGSSNLYQECIELLEKLAITEVLRHTAGNQVEAARILGITRNTLRRKIQGFNLAIERSVIEPLDSPDSAR